MPLRGSSDCGGAEGAVDAARTDSQNTIPCYERSDPGYRAMDGPRHGNCQFPTQRSQFLLESPSTDVQAMTEHECAPFFVSLPSLSDGQLQHLRSVGLLPPIPPSVSRPDGKAAKLLGLSGDDDDDIDDVDDSEPTIELLDDDDGIDGTQDYQQNNADDYSDGKDFDPYAIRLVRDAHIKYLLHAMCVKMPRGFVSLDASHPWMIYWTLHSLDLLGHFDDGYPSKKNSSDVKNQNKDPLSDVEVLQKANLLERIVSTLRHCWTDVELAFGQAEVDSDLRLKKLASGEAGVGLTPARIKVKGGGFGGGPQQMPHCATTYAAVLALSIVTGIGLSRSESHPFYEPGKMAYGLLNRKRLQMYAFFLSLREVVGDRTSFRMQHDGEIDVRSIYCILAPCHLLGLLDDGRDCEHYNNPLRDLSISRHIADCQTFEGGFGAEPFNEAHGGYTFCALAALRILGTVSLVDIDTLQSWLARRQMGFEGGFCGRTNKLVDGCYSFWQGGAVAVLDSYLGDEMKSSEISYDEQMLQRYILLCAQDVNGGLRDKPSKPKDFYHSCYNLSGLSVAQHAVKPWPLDALGASGDDLNELFGDRSNNILGRTDGVLNIRIERVQEMRKRFK